MSHVYHTINSKHQTIHLCQRNNVSMPYCITVCGVIVAYCECLGDAYRLYNEYAR